MLIDRRRLEKLCRLWICPGLLTVSLIAQEPSHPETQQVIFENDLIRVWDIHVPAGVAEPVHHHARGVTIALSDYENEGKSVPDGKVSHGHTKFGEVKWAEPVTHEARNTGTTGQRVIRLELKKEDLPRATAEADPLDSLVVCKDTQKLIFENAYVRTIDDRIPPGVSEPKHAHPHGIAVAVSDYTLETTNYPPGHATPLSGKAGNVIWTGGEVHDVRNLGPAEARFVRIDIK